MIQRFIKKIHKEWRNTPFGKVKKSQTSLRWGIIGLGYMAETFSCAIDGNKDGIVYAVASRSLEKAKKFASRHGNCRYYGSYEEMVHDDSLNLDVIYIATPVKYHYEHIKMCLLAGLNVLCEKPITSSLEEYDELVKLAVANDCFFMEGMWMKCLPSFQKACQWILDGKIGKTELIKVDFYKREHIRPQHSIYKAEEGGGVLRDFGVYAISFVEHFLDGIPDEINYTYRKSSHGIDSDWQISLQKNNIKAVVNISSNFGSLSKAAVIGSSGFVEWHSQFNRTNCVDLYNNNGELVDSYVAKYDYEGFEFEVNEVQSCILQNKKESQSVSLDSTRYTMQIINYLLKV